MQAFVGLPATLTSGSAVVPAPGLQATARTTAPQIHLTERAAECGVNLLDQEKPREQQLLTRINQIAKDLGIYCGSNHATKVLGVLALVSWNAMIRTPSAAISARAAG